MSADDTFRCPGCGTELNIPAHLYVERELRESKAYRIQIGDQVPTPRPPLPCPRCGHAIPVDHILKRPSKSSGCAETLTSILILGGLLWLILRFSGGCGR